MTSVYLFLETNKGFCANTCIDCHKKTVVSGVHSGIKCVSCHKKNSKHYEKDSTTFRDNLCIGCHKNFEGILNNIMVHRDKEKRIIAEAFNNVDKNFFEKNCKGFCHVTKCLDCHTFNSDSHNVEKPKIHNCLKCHKAYYTGIEYTGLAIREDHERYKRGIYKDGEYYLKMLPDVHFEKGLKCNDCHNMTSFAENKRYAKSCVDCHQSLDKTIVDHSIEEHLEKLECYACHSAWAVSELGSFYVQFIDSDVKRFYKSLKHVSQEYIKSSFIKEYGPPFLGINSKNKYSPVRPQFIFFYTQIYKNQLVGDDNRYLGGFWRAFYPHTIRAETVMCENCHENRKRYLLLDNNTDYYELSKDDIDLTSFFSSDNQRIINGYFIDNMTYCNRINKKSIKYIEHYIKKWKEFKKFIESVEEH